MRKLTAVVTLSILSLVSSGTAQPVPAGDVSRRAIRLDIRGASCPEIISAIALMNKLPTGFQQRAGTAAVELEKKRDVLFPNRIALGMFMPMLMPDCPGYSWSGGSALHVFPAPKEESVLDVVIPEFAVEDLNPQEIVDRIFESAEVKKFLKDQKISRSTAGKGLSAAVPDAGKYRFAFNGKSVRDILNHLVVVSGYKIWVHQGPSSDRSISLSIF